jgi:hypothetical protein
MPPQKTTRPPTQQRMVQRQLIDDPQQAHRVTSDGIAALETKVGKLQKLITTAPTITGSKGGNAALTSLISALVELGIVKDGTT